ncbi:FAD dependent oxidoreductase-domain-containing protein [Gloeopeniophorella convolvens]|nr:FAD dependent oxidoreductase-domain-containing protein [Gloeopeniophorella convolvens]
MLRRTLLSRKALAYASAGTLAAAGGGYYFLNSGPAYPTTTRESRKPQPPWLPPTREQNLNTLKASASGDDDAKFDLLIVGGGATGAGVAVDAASRGLKVALVERDDFSSGTSSKSTKLVHGGVRYLQKAVMELDYEQYKLVREALHERRIFLQTAPYLSHMLPIMLPIYKYWQVPYYWVGCKMYDILAGKENMESSYLMSKGKALETFPMLNSEGLVGALVYYDGQHNDARMNMALVMTAVKLGATVANKIEVVRLLKDDEGKIEGARVRDNLTGEEWQVKARGVVNATGPFSDAMLTMDNPEHKPIVQASSGVHITLPNYYSPRTMGLLDPATSDGRVIFFLPWEGNTIAGTTDTPAPVESEPRAAEDEIRWVLEEVRRYLSPDIKVRRGDVLSAWSGLRPLVRNPAASSTEGLVRNHMIYTSPSGLLTIAGGKWTTYRAMAQETVDEAVKVFGLENRVTSGCVTEQVRLVGSDAWSRNMFIGLIQRYGLDTEVAKHLSNNYGDRAWTVLSLAHPTGDTWPLYGVRLAPQYPFIEAEVRYAVRHEYALTATDVIARRIRLSFLNAQASLEALPRIVDIMAEELQWDAKRKEDELTRTARFLQSMGLQPGAITASPARGAQGWREWARTKLEGAGAVPSGKKSTTNWRAQFEPGEVDNLREAFVTRSRDPAGRLGKAAIRELLLALPAYASIRTKDFEYVLEETGLARQKDVDVDEFVEICAELKEVSFAPVSRSVAKNLRLAIPVEKSGGGV